MTDLEIKKLIKEERRRIYKELKDVFAKSFSGYAFGYHVSDNMKKLIAREDRQDTE